MSQNRARAHSRRIEHHLARSLPVLLLGSLLAIPVCASTVLVNSLSDSGSGSCATTCTLRDAIASAAVGDTILFSNTLTFPATITLNGNELLAYKSMSIVGPGPGQLTIDGNNASRILEISLNATVNVSGVRFYRGAAMGAPGSTPPGANATNGGPAFGGAVLVDPGASLSLSECVLDSNQVTGGTGGLQNSPAALLPGNGGDGSGGAIYNSGFLIMERCALINNGAHGGNGGDNLSFGLSSNGGLGGNGIGGAIGGGGQSELVNVLLAQNQAVGGSGGNVLPPFPGTRGGTGGNGTAGALSPSGFSVLEFVTASGNTTVGGLPGFPPGSAAGNGSIADLLAGATVLARSTVFASGNGSCALNGGTIVVQGANLASDNSCAGFTVNANMMLKPLSVGMDGYPIVFPAYASPVIDAAIDCNDAFGNMVTQDLEAIQRPQGPKCDLGAIETDYIFVNGFEP